ncbi:MAG: hydroxymethylbilane synthase [Planctomycetes bacterium]|nr:hydroxymethylbilane synthase [Planctomycetota bacterium]
MKLRLGTRGSALALAQARDMRARLAALGHEGEIVVVKTRGDGDQVRPFAQVGAPGLFVRELEHALLDGAVDVAVHCYKDLPSDSPAELVVTAMPEREDTRDVLLVRAEAHDAGAAHLPVRTGACVGTASARRQSLVRHLRGDLSTELLRGNVPTRVQKLKDGAYDAILLAAAGLARLERAAAGGAGEPIDLSGVVVSPLDPADFVPAPSQGALALQTRVDDDDVRAALVPLDDARAHAAVRAERELLRLVEAGCQVPFGAWAELHDDGTLTLHAALEVDGALRRHRARAASTRPSSRARATTRCSLGAGGPAA